MLLLICRFLLMFVTTETFIFALICAGVNAAFFIFTATRNTILIT